MPKTPSIVDDLYMTVGGASTSGVQERSKPVNQVDTGKWKIWKDRRRDIEHCIVAANEHSSMANRTLKKAPTQPSIPNAPDASTYRRRSVDLKGMSVSDSCLKRSDGLELQP